MESFAVGHAVAVDSALAVETDRVDDELVAVVLQYLRRLVVEVQAAVQAGSDAERVSFRNAHGAGRRLLTLKK